jgi:transcription elongation factor Elf1
MIYIDRKYLLLASSRLGKFSEKNTDLFNFRCPFCGDSQKNRNRARGYVYRKNDAYLFKCHNCNHSTSFGRFLKTISEELYKEYAVEQYVNGKTYCNERTAPIIPPEQTSLDKSPVERYKNAMDLTIDSIGDLPKGHYARSYIEARKIPHRFLNEVFYTSNYKEFLDREFPFHEKENIPEDERIVLLYTNSNGTITNVTGRSLAADNKMRYVTVKILDEKKIFGLHHLKPGRVYITEGQFDSMFLPNAVASGDSNLNGLARYLKNDYDDIVLVYDNQPRNKELVKQISDSIDENYKVVMLPYDPNNKDINEMIKSGMSQQEIKTLIDANTYSGLVAKMKFIEWRK